jgi:hypothetical protein
MTRPFPFLTEAQWHQEQSPRLCPLCLQGQSCLPCSLSWQSFTMSRALHPGIRLLRCLRPPSHTLAFSRPRKRQGGIGVPQFQDIRRIEIPLAACCRPGALGTTPDGKLPLPARHLPFWARCVSHFHLSALTISTQISRVSIGIRSGQSPRLWLPGAELLSLGFPPPRVPLVNAGQVDLTPLFMCNPLNGLSVCPVKGRASFKDLGFTHESVDKNQTHLYVEEKQRTKMFCTGISQTLIYRLPSLSLSSLLDEGFLFWDGAHYQCI